MEKDKNKNNSKIICYGCEAELVQGKADLTYLGKTFHADVLRCPICKKVYILPELAEGRIAEVEQLLEEK